MNFYAPCPPGAGQILGDELRRIGAEAIKASSRGVSFKGDLSVAYSACLGLRTASRILLELASGDAKDEDALYNLALEHPWEEEFSPDMDIACRVTGVPNDKDPRFATLRLKDGIVDRFSNQGGIRPSVDRHNPDIRIEARWDGRRGIIYLNWSGNPLHERGYRLERTDAVLRETTAAALLFMAGWPEMAAQGGSFVDPVCGSGTLLAEAALMAMDAPPGIMRQNWGFDGLKRHDQVLWRGLLNEGKIRFGQGFEKMPAITGYDIDPIALKAARSNLRRAGLHQSIRLEKHDITQGIPESWPPGEAGLLCADPPYGVRYEADPSDVYKGLGSVFRELDTGWRMALLAPDKKTAAGSCLRAYDYHRTVSGGLDLVLALYERHGAKSQTEAAPGTILREKKRPAAAFEPDPKASSLKTALERNIKALGSWAEKSGISSYRIWDAEMPEFNAAVDWYEGRWLLVQEFAAPGKVPAEKSRRRLITLIEVLKECTGCDDSGIFLKTRQKGLRPYGKMGDSNDRFIMRENGRKFFINLSDYLDSGIFLDHRPTRALIESQAKDARFLNLFAYTGSATVMAASGGAKRTVSIDVSNTYLSWAKDNMRLNGFDSKSNAFLRSDAFAYLKETQEEFDLIFVDPPTYSNGAGRNDWSVQDHHKALLRFAMKRLAPGGVLYFSENYRRFSLEPLLKREFDIKEITAQTMPPDFAKRGKAHRCWQFRHKGMK